MYVTVPDYRIEAVTRSRPGAENEEHSILYRDEQGIVWAGGYYNFKSMNFATGEIDHYQTEYPISIITSKSNEELWV